ncbi:MAG: hypothetical protein WA821_02395 [Anaerolineales bacterium]
MAAKKIQAWTEFGPRLEPADPITPETLIEHIVQGTNQTRGSVKAILDELDAQIEIGLKEGRVVQLPNGTHFRPTGKKDGSIQVDVRVNPDLVQRVNGLFRGKWRNSDNIGKDEQEIVDQWNAKHPDDPIA